MAYPAGGLPMGAGARTLALWAKAEVLDDFGGFTATWGTFDTGKGFGLLQEGNPGWPGYGHEFDTEGNALGRFPHPEPPYQNFVFNLGLAVNEQDRTLLFTTSAYGDHGITKVLEMNFEGNLTGFALPLPGLGNEIRDIELYGRELVAIGSGSFSELLRIKFTDTLPAPFLRGAAATSGEVIGGRTTTVPPDRPLPT